MKKINIYPAGGVQKGENDKDKVSWTEGDMDLFKRKLAPANVNFIDPRYRNDDLNDHFAVFGRDLMAVKVSDFVIVDGRQKRGIGVGQEMLFAKMQGIPVITIAPKGGHYRKGKLEYLGQKVDDYVHPFIFSTSDVIVENFEEAAEWVKNYLENPVTVKNSRILDEAMDIYVKKYMADDDPVNEAVKDE